MTSASMLSRAREVFDIEVRGLEATRDSLGESFTTAIRMMLDCQARGGIVVVTGVGKNLHVAEKMSAIFSSTGTRSIVLNPVQAMHGDLGMVSAKDLLLALSFSGESAEVNNLIPAIRRHGLKVISMTRDAESTLAKLSDCHIAIPCGREACPFGMAPTNSTTATMAMGDALAMVMVDAQEFKIESYAMNHPAGAIGRALVMKVTDIMRTGEKLAKVPPTATVMDALMAMTAAKGGSAVIADASGKLLGIFTDGDFRRHFSNCDFSIPDCLESSEDLSVDQSLADNASENRGGEKAPIANFKFQISDRQSPISQSPISQSPISQSQIPQSPISQSAQLNNAIENRKIEKSKNLKIEEFMRLPVGDFMTRSPLFVRDDAYAAELLKIFEKKRIDDLPVCDAEGRVVGLVDIQDLPKMKVI